VEWPKVVVVMLTWCGPPDRRLADTRLEYTRKTVDSLHEHLLYPNWSWHIGDDGSGEEYQQKVFKILGEDEHTFTDTRAGGDIGLNLNLSGRAAYAQSPVVVFWQDDRWLVRDLDLKPCVTLLMEHEDICLIRLKPGQPGMIGYETIRDGHKWWVIDKLSPCAHVCCIGPNIRHRRFREAYGEYPFGVQVDVVENHMNMRFRYNPGPGVACPDSRWRTTEIPWGATSTWE